MMTHTGKRPYQYSKCDKAFLLRGNLICHLRTHTGEKPFFCTNCDKSFTQHGELNRQLISYKNYFVIQ